MFYDVLVEYCVACAFIDRCEMSSRCLNSLSSVLNRAPMSRQVCLLQKLGGVKSFMRIAPLFETRSDLINAPRVVDAVLGVPWYKQHIQGKWLD